MSNPLSPVNVYVPVSVPGTISVCYFDDNTASFKHKQEVEEQSKYVFDREALEKIISYAWEEGVKNGYDNCKNGHSNENTKQQTINSLFKQ